MKKKIMALLMLCIMVFTMVPATAFAGENNAEDEPSCYNYEETDAESVKAYVTISDDGMPLQGRDEAKSTMAHLEVDVPYFDLAEYGMEEYYRYETKGGFGSYINTKLIKRPTTLHLFIYVAERYYLGLPEDECGVAKEVSKVMDFCKATTVKYMDGTEAYTSNGTMKAFSSSGSPTSFYINGGFWGHDENLNYYRNHRFPLMNKAYGATADYMLLSDGDIIEVALNSDWDKISTGDFLCFNKDDYEGEAGKTLTVSTMGTKRNGWDETPILDFTEELNVALYDANWKKTDAKVESKGNGVYDITLPSKAGDYYLLGIGYDAKTSSCVDSPAAAKVVVTKATEETPQEPSKPQEPETPQQPQEPEKPQIDEKAEAVKAANVTLTAKATDYKTVKLSWNKVKDADQYEVYRATSQKGTYSKISTTTKTTLTNSKDMKTGKTYYYKVRAKVTLSNGTVYSKFSAVKTAKPVLAKVTGVKAKAGTKKATVSWSKVSGADGYVVYRCDSGSKYKTVKTITNSKKVKWTNSKLKKGKTYKYRVKAYRIVDGKKVYSTSYSKIVKVKVK